MRRLLCTGLLMIAALGCGGGADRPTDTSSLPAPSVRAAPAETPSAHSPSGPATGQETRSAEAEPHRDLRIDEQLGGHTLSRHVGRSDDELSERLRRERDISAASTYLDRASAERVVERALDVNQSRIRQWAQRHGDRPNLALHYVDRSRSPTGRILLRNAAASRAADGALVVLRWNEHRRQWYVLTSYPELAR